MVDTEKLISLVYERKPLWDVQSKNYHNRDVARKLWLEIGFTQSLLSYFNNDNFNKGFSNNNNCSSILMYSKRSPIKNWRDVGLRACAV